eukprot:m.16336 g.16336  ORF g.16336 m.16336 type:complete len:355 (-) comp10998_c0_seq1:53-1117(-)
MDLICECDNEQSVKHVLKHFFPALSSLSDFTIRLTTISGGITNQIRRVDVDNPPTGVPATILLRIFGGADVIDRDVEDPMFEAITIYLTQPKYYGRFGNGRLEGWLDGFRPLKMNPVEVADYKQAIAQRLAKLHTIVVPDHLKKHFSKPQLWSTIWKWYEFASSKETRDIAITQPSPTPTPTSQDMYDALRLGDPQTKATLQQLEKGMPASATAFCHNDALPGNIMLNESTQEIILIDFEYGGINYVAFDIANHFNEYAGGNDDGMPNYSRFPSRADQEEFCCAYLEAVHGSPPSASELSTLLSNVDVFVQINNWYWGLWGVCQARSEGTESFPYLTYSTNRIAQARHAAASSL